MALSPGTEFGAYRILGLLGEGGMARVYHAYQPDLDREVALKLISPQLADNPRFLASFRREAQILARLEHAHILPIYAFGEQDGRPYIAYRYIRGGTLRERLSGTRWPVAEVVRLLRPVAEALDFAHAHGVIHRDVKPSNILLTPDGTPVVADFGIARLLSASAEGMSVTGTETGMGIGSPPYMAPEQIEQPPDGTLDGRLDEYALGIVAYELLTGGVPFTGATPWDVAWKQAHAPLPMPRARNPQLSNVVERVLLAALAKAPDHRYPTCGAFIEALDAAARSPTRLAGEGPYAVATSPADVPPVDEATGFVPRPRTAPSPPSFSRSTPPPFVPPVDRLSAAPVRGARRHRPALYTLAAVAIVALGATVAAAASGRLPGPWQHKVSPVSGAVMTPTPGTVGPTPPRGSIAPAPSVAFVDPQALIVGASGTIGVFDAGSASDHNVRFIGLDGRVVRVPKTGLGARAVTQAMDTAGNIYFPDDIINAIRKVAPDGSTTTFAGSGVAGYKDGPGSQAQFQEPAGIAVDHSGNVYLADRGNNRIRKILPDGTVSTLAGSGVKGWADGSGTSARFNGPAGVATDAAGDVYVADMGNHRIRKITRDGKVSTLAGTGKAGFIDAAAAEARFDFPAGVALDAAGNVYVADSYNQRIRKITSDGRVVTLAGSGTAGFIEGSGAVAEFNLPLGVAVDANGLVYVADFTNRRIRLITPDGNVSTLAGAGAAAAPGQ